MTTDLSSQVSIVTGAGAGLGRAHALALAAHGARIVVNDFNESAASAVRADIIAGAGTPFGFRLMCHSSTKRGHGGCGDQPLGSNRHSCQQRRGSFATALLRRWI